MFVTSRSVALAYRFVFRRETTMLFEYFFFRRVLTPYASLPCRVFGPRRREIPCRPSPPP